MTAQVFGAFADPLTPDSARDFAERMVGLVEGLLYAGADLSEAWNRRQRRRWPDGGGRTPETHPMMVSADRELAAARDRWRAAEAALRSFFASPTELRCGVRSWIPGQSCVFCTLPALHLGVHDFEPRATAATGETP